MRTINSFQVKNKYIPLSITFPKRILNMIPALEVGEIMSGKKLEVGLPVPCPV